MEELSHVLWTYQTTPWRSMGKIPFSMTYGAEAVLAIENSFPTLKSNTFTPNNNDELLGRSLDLTEEKREKAMIHMAYYHQKLKQRYDVNVKLRPLSPADLVMRKILGSAKNPSWGKLGPAWERPYCITSVAGIGAYYLEDLDDKTVPRPWNVNNLRIYCY